MVKEGDQTLGTSIVVEDHGPVAPPAETHEGGLTWRSIPETIARMEGWFGKGIHEISRELDAANKSVDQGLSQPGNNWLQTAGLGLEKAGLWTATEARGGVRNVENWMSAHPTAAAAIATGLDVIGVLGGLTAVVCLWPAEFTAIAIAAVSIPVAAELSSWALLYEDYIDTSLRIKGDLAARRGDIAGATKAAFQTDQHEQSTIYRTIELLGPLIALPDAGRSALAAGQDIAKASRKLAAVDARTAAVTRNLQTMDEANEAMLSDAALKAQTREEGQKILAQRDQFLQKKTASLKRVYARQQAAHQAFRAGFLNNSVLPTLSREAKERVGISMVDFPPGWTAVGTAYTAAGTPALVGSVLAPDSPPLGMHAQTSPIQRLAPPEPRSKIPVNLTFRLFVSTALGQPHD
jgi:hypothetical protein